MVGSIKKIKFLRDMFYEHPSITRKKELLELWTDKVKFEMLFLLTKFSLWRLAETDKNAAAFFLTLNHLTAF